MGFEKQLLKILLNKEVLEPLLWCSSVLLGVSATLLGVIKVGTMIKGLSLVKYIEYLTSLEVASLLSLKSLVLCVILHVFRTIPTEKSSKNLLTLLAIVSAGLFALMIGFLASAIQFLYNAIKILPELSF